MLPFCISVTYITGLVNGAHYNVNCNERCCMKPISVRQHTIIGIVLGAALLIAPWLFGFADVEAAKWSAIFIGIVVLLSELTTTSPVSPIKLMPMRMHVMTDYVVGAILALSPWLFNFAESAVNAWLPHVLVGLVVIAYAALTRVDMDEQI